jgi:hypothetical protein
MSSKSGIPSIYLLICSVELEDGDVDGHDTYVIPTHGASITLDAFKSIVTAEWNQTELEDYQEYMCCNDAGGAARALYRNLKKQIESHLKTSGHSDWGVSRMKIEYWPQLSTLVREATESQSVLDYDLPPLDDIGTVIDSLNDLKCSGKSGLGMAVDGGSQTREVSDTMEAVIRSLRDLVVSLPPRTQRAGASLIDSTGSAELIEHILGSGAPSKSLDEGSEP